MKIVSELFGNTADSTRTYELVESDILMNVIKRNEVIERFNKDNVFQQAGLYYLLGYEHYYSLRQVYIGETANIDKRIRKHLIAKDFWEYAVIFTKKSNEQLTKSEVQYLEHIAIKTCIECGNVQLLENCQIPKLAYLSDNDIINMNDFFKIVKLLLEYAGFNIYNNYQICEVDTNNNSHTIVSRLVKDYKNKTVKSINNVNNSDNDECGTDVECNQVSYILEPDDKSCCATAIETSDGLIMILPFGYISNAVNLSDLKDIVDIDECFKNRNIKKDIKVKDLETAAYIVCGQRDKSLWKQKIYYIDEEY